MSLFGFVSMEILAIAGLGRVRGALSGLIISDNMGQAAAWLVENTFVITSIEPVLFILSIGVIWRFVQSLVSIIVEGNRDRRAPKLQN